jgi:hypothetical protein
MQCYCFECARPMGKIRVMMYRTAYMRNLGVFLLASQVRYENFIG